jgi:CheY-like chemotaxis protein
MHTQLTILCIDDEQLELSLRKMVLEDAGYAVFTATNASKALEVFRSNASTW